MSTSIFLRDFSSSSGEVKRIVVIPISLAGTRELSLSSIKTVALASIPAFSNAIFADLSSSGNVTGFVSISLETVLGSDSRN